MASRRFIICLGRVFLFLSISIHAVGQQWVRVSSAHFSVLTDGGHSKAHDIVARFEQMRAMFGQLLAREKVRMGQPLEIIAVSSPASYAQLLPAAAGTAAEAPGLFLTGEDRIYVLLNASDPDCWRAVEYPFGLYLLNYNYPPTPVWFDQGFAEYFASVNFTPTNTELGGDPEFPSTNQASASGNHLEATKRGSLLEVLRNSPWLPLAELLQAKPGSLTKRPQDQARYQAQSWVLVNYLIQQNKLSETGAYFELVENRKLPPSQAVQQAYGMSIEQLDQSVKEYFQNLQASAGVRSPATPAGGNQASKPAEGSPLPIALADVADSMQQIPAWEAQALMDELEVHIPERRDAAMERLEKLIADRRTETVAAHRALAWGYLEKQDLQGAFQELNSAVQLNSSDSWTRMALALASYRSGEKGARVQGLANMMESLHIVLREYPDYAQAYYLLGWAQLAGGGANAAVQSLRQAVQLNPRREDYKLRLAAAYMGAKKWDEAVPLLDSLKSSESPEIATAAKKDLHDIPFLRKFGIPPEEQEAAKQEAGNGENATEEQADSDESEAKKPDKAATPPLDKRPIAFLKEAKLMSVDCSHAPEAVLVVFQGRKTLRLHTANYESLLVIGGEKFSCGWKDLPVNVNYRAGGKMDGDLVSLELR